MNRAAFALVALFAAIPAVGCGTLANQSEDLVWGDRTWGERTVYGGVRTDAALLTTPVVKKPTTDDKPFAESSDARKGAGVFEKSVYLFDLPLSLVSDTVFLPFDAYCQWQRSRGKTPLLEQLRAQNTQ